MTLYVPRAHSQYASLVSINTKLAVTAKIPTPPLKASKKSWRQDIIWTARNVCSWHAHDLLAPQLVRNHSQQCGRCETCEKQSCMHRDGQHWACFTWRVTTQIKLKHTVYWKMKDGVIIIGLVALPQINIWNILILCALHEFCWHEF